MRVKFSEQCLTWSSSTHITWLLLFIYCKHLISQMRSWNLRSSDFHPTILSKTCHHLLVYVDKEDVVIYNGISLSHKKEWNNAICSNMNGPRDYQTKLSKSDRKRQKTWYSITSMWNLTKDTNELIYRIYL